jgi:excisionase family DNA binding protein
MFPANTHQANEPPIAVSLREACRLSGLGLATIRRLIREGSLQAPRIGRRVLVTRSSLQQLLEGGETR